MTAETPASRPSQQVLDCRAASVNLRLDRIIQATVDGPPSLRFEDCARETPKRQIGISEAAARLASALHLHLD